MPGRSAEEFGAKGSRARAARRRAPARSTRMPSTAGYMAGAVAISVAVFFALWWLMRAGEDEAPWLPAGLAAGCVMLVAAAAREVVMRRAWARYTREMELEMRGDAPARAVVKPSALPSTVHASANALRTLQVRLTEADAPGALPEAHLEAYRLCEQYLASNEEAMRSAGAPEVRAALRAGQERVRALQKNHLLAWARGEATARTLEASRRVRTSDKIETAQRALDVIEEALRVYPAEQELHQSSAAVRNFIASVRVGQWVEMAERAAFRGRYSRAIARYRDALFYLSRADMGEDARGEAAERIQREIELLRARLATDDATTTVRPVKHAARRKAATRSAPAPPPDDAREADGLTGGEAEV
ncbi:MAG TPA: hypothetical protein VER32_11060 [Pyrinomonadaceae bacterium]|nr:hypothetical protein [Pyrinomonadaceae bacterium]